MKPLSSVSQNMKRSGIRVLMELAAKVPDVIRLEAGEPDFITPDHIIDGGFEAAKSGFTKYTTNAGFLSLREAIVDKLVRVNQLEVEPNNIVVTSGAVSSLSASIFAIAEEGDEVLVPDPGWPPYRSMVELAHAIPVPFLLDAANDFALDMDELNRRVTSKTKAIIINSPSNPAGSVFNGEVMEYLVAFARQHDLYVISDEVYEELVFEGEHVSPARFDGDGRVVSVFGASKTYAMTGWRLGYLMGSEEITTLVKKLLEPLISCAPAISQKAVEAALRGPQDCVEEFRSSYQRRRDRVVEILEPAGLLGAVPRGAFYALVDISSTKMDSDTFVRELLEETSVAAAPGATFGSQSEGYVRISFATREEDLVEGLHRIKAFIKKKAVPPKAPKGS